MKYISLLLCFISVNALGQQTPFEISKGQKSATYFEAADWYKKLQKKSTILIVKTMGETDAGYPLHLTLISSDSKFDPIGWHRSKKVVILINNGIHPGEPDGIDASMMLARDIVNKKIVLPPNVALAIIPVYNIGGALNRNSTTRVNQNGPVEYGFRGNSQNLDLNRDFTKNDSRESRSFAQIFHFLDPDIFIDTHVSDGADYQHTMTLITTQYDKLGNLGTYLRKEFEPLLFGSMKNKGWEMIPYMNFEFMNADRGMAMFNESPRYSTGYAALFNTMGFMPETHMLKDYQTRVSSTYDLMRVFIETAAGQANKIKTERQNAKNTALAANAFTLSWKADTSIFKKFVFNGYTQKFATSAATGLEKMYYDKGSPYTDSIKFFNRFIPADTVKKPRAYLIPQGWQEVVDRLKLNRVTLKQLQTDTILRVTGYRIESYKSFPNPYEKHHKNYAVKVSSSVVDKKFLKGDYRVELNQAANRYLVEMLEPAGDDSFFAWNFFDGILQQKEGYSDYRWEDLAAAELQKNPGLKSKLEQKKKADLKFAASSKDQLEFIYKNSPYYEAAHMAYPVYRVED
ncbi:MAG: M14 family zinc carboxypeptidase [Ferruginibacter sp.]